MASPGTLLPDVPLIDAQGSRQLGILAPAPSADLRAAQERLGLDLTALNADGTDTLPMPTVVIADAGHTLRWIDVHPNYSTRTEVADIVDALRSVL
ncbi:MAG: hypothetical protein JO115_01875 [Pseudonocardiales bacterium]|nr:hypothetical protein [Pseudonocardiales bacterium]